MVALCDSGSTVSYVDQTVLDDLKLRVMRDITRNVAGILGQNDLRSQQAWLHVQPRNGQAKPSKIIAFTDPSLNIGSGVLHFIELKNQFPHLSKLPNDVLSLQDVKMVIGQDVYHLIRPLEYRSGHVNEPWAVRTELGWTVSGPLPKSSRKELKVLSNLSVAQDSRTE